MVQGDLMLFQDDVDSLEKISVANSLAFFQQEIGSTAAIEEAVSDEKGMRQIERIMMNMHDQLTE